MADGARGKGVLGPVQVRGASGGGRGSADSAMRVVPTAERADERRRATGHEARVVESSEWRGVQ